MSLYRLMATYWTRYAELVEAMAENDQFENGAPEKAEADAKQDAAGDVLEDASIAVLEFVPSWGIDAEIKASFVRGLFDRNGGTLYEHELEALLSSLTVVYAPRKGGEA